MCSQSDTSSKKLRLTFSSFIIDRRNANAKTLIGMKVQKGSTYLIRTHKFACLSCVNNIQKRWNVRSVA